MPEQQELFTFSKEDSRDIAKMLEQFRKRPLNFVEQIVDKTNQAPECYIVKVPEEGIPPLSDDEPGSLECDVYKIKENGSSWQIVQVEGLTKLVFNLTSSTITAGYIAATRDKFGRWIAGKPGSGSSDTGACITPESIGLPSSPYGTGSSDGTYALVLVDGCLEWEEIEDC